MAEYIKREDCIQVAEKYFTDFLKLNPDICIGGIRFLPAADVIERKKGKWTLNKDGSGTCSECGRRQNNCWDADNWDNFCHFCGADMRGET